MTKSNLGELGEKIAEKFFVGKGFRVLKKNYRSKFGEIDLIVKDSTGILVFVEVKTVLINEWTVLKPEDNFIQQKYNKVKRMAEFFVGMNPCLIDEDLGWRIDLVAIEMGKSGEYNVRHYENI